MNLYKLPSYDNVNQYTYVRQEFIRIIYLYYY